MTTPILRITDGTDTVDLLARGKGYHLRRWRPKSARLKNGGVWQSSPLAHGRQLVSYRYDNVIESFDLVADGYDEDGLIRLGQTLERLAAAALDYWAGVSDTPVYLMARGGRETNTRYAILHQMEMPEWDDPYREPAAACEPVMDNLILLAERGQWQSAVPGQSACVEVSSVFDWRVQGWETNTTTPTGDVLALFQLTSGRILAGTNDAAKIYYSDDGAVTWGLLATLGTGTDAVNDFCISPTGALIAAVSGAIKGIRRSTDNGASWSSPAGSPVTYNAYAVSAAGSYIEVVGGDGTDARRRTSNNDFVSSGTIESTYGNGPYRSNVALSTVVLMGRNGFIHYSLGSTSADAPIFTTSGTVRSFLQLASGRVLAATDSGSIYKSDINGEPGSWSLLSELTGGVFSLIQLVNGNVLAGGDGIIWVSIDNGVSWGQDSEQPTAEVTSLLIGAISENEIVLAGENGQILKLDSTAAAVVAGRDATCTNEVYVANKLQSTNLTNILVYDESGTSYTETYPASAFPVTLLPATPAVDDAIYFGIDTNLADVETSPFVSLVFGIETPASGVTNVWEYWNGSAWATLTTQDNTLGLGQSGVNSVHWTPPSDWATTSVASITGWWVRLRVTAVSSPIAPTQANRNIYTVVNGYVEIAASAVGGDFPALARLKIENVSDKDGPGGSAPDLYANRVLVGLRSVSRGALFTAYLNASDEQNPVGVTVTAQTDTTFVDDPTAPTGRKAQWSPTGTGVYQDILSFYLATTIAAQYYGVFRCFLRCRQAGGSVGQMQLRLEIQTGSGGVAVTTEAQSFTTLNDWQVLDFGQVVLPVSSYIRQDELGDALQIIVQGYTSSTTPDVDMYDLVLMPVDEWAADLNDANNSTASALSAGYYLNIDSVGYPKQPIRNSVRASGTDFVKAIWQQIQNGETMLQANERQRLWFMTTRTASAGSADVRSEPSVCHRVQVFAAQRYRYGRGDQ